MNSDLDSKIADEYGETPDGRRKLRVIEGLKRNFEKYGASYCPCKMDHIEDNICPCKDYRDTGKCICGLYYPHEYYDNTK